MLNNQPMGFYHPATLVKDAQRHGVRFAPIDVQVSDWECRVEPDGRVRLGLMYVNGLREAVGRAIAAGLPSPVAAAPRDAVQVLPSSRSQPKRCPKCGCDDESMLEETPERDVLQHLRARVGQSGARPSHQPRSADPPAEPAGRYRSIDALIAAPACGATNWPRWPRSARSTPSAIIAAARCGRSSGPCGRQESCSLNGIRDRGSMRHIMSRGSGPDRDRHTRLPLPARIRRVDPPRSAARRKRPRTSNAQRPAPNAESRVRIPVPARVRRQPLAPMTPPERLMADYAGTSLTIGPHPLALRRAELALRGVLRARDLPHGRHGRRVRVAGAVITRQRPGHGEGVCVPHARGRNRDRQHHRAAGSLHRAARRRSSARPICSSRARCRSRKGSRRSRPSGSCH